MNTAPHEQDNIDSWRKELDAYNRANSPLQRKLHIKRQQTVAQWHETISQIIGGFFIAAGIVIFLYLLFGFNK